MRQFNILKYSILLFLTYTQVNAQKYNPSETRTFDLIHTQLDVTPNWETSSLAGEAILKLKPFFYPQNQVILDAKGFEIKSIDLNGQQTQDFNYDGIKLQIELGKSYTNKDTLQIAISYIARPNELASIEGLKHPELKGLYFVNDQNPMGRQIWTEGETQYNSCWFPTIDAPNEKHTQQISITVDTAFTTLSNGLLIKSETNGTTRKDTWLQKIPHSVYLTMIAAGNFTKVVDPSFKDFEVSYYVEPQFEKNAIDIFGNTPEMIRFFEQKLGVKYPWEKYAQIAVKDYISGAMENTSATVHGSGIQQTKPQLIDNKPDGIIAHELFHHWFGDLVTCESWANLSLNEGFADYSEQLWAEHKYGKTEGDYTAINARIQYFIEAEDEQKQVIRFGYEDMEDMFDSHTYAKGGRILHMLRRLIGDEAFWKGLNYYLTEHAYETVEIHDLRQAMERVSGMDLNWFFNQWYLSKGHPDLFVEHSIKDNILTLYVEQTQIDSANNNLFQFPLEVLVGTKAGQELKTFWIDESEEYLEIPLADSLTFISVDPDASLLAMVDHVKSDELLIAQMQIKDYLAPRLEAFDLLTYTPDDGDGIILNPVHKKPIRDLVLAATEDPFWGLRDKAVQKFFDYDGEDFLKVERQLQSVIRTDKRSQVRASAILAMKNFLNAQNDLIFRNSLNDSTYIVQAAALEGILMNNPPDAESLVAKYRNINDVHIFGSVANYIASNGTPQDLDWFMEKIKNFDGGAKYQVIGLLGTFLIQTDEETKVKAIPFLKDIAMNESMWFVRFQAGQTLMLFGDIPEALSTLKEVVSHEKEEKVLNLYKQFPLD
ncbi:aminopeptidase N [Spirosomataceae bacterium TFI 002]|nr:aminopeptidase N [Spirosomataceae bacterium TFI 002]